MQEPGPRSVARVGDFARDGARIDVPGNAVASTPLISGKLIHEDLRHGLAVHGSDVVEERAFTVESSIHGGLSCVFFLRGTVDASVGGRPIPLGRDAGQRVRTALLMNADPASFVRRTPVRQRVEHLVVTASPEWLEADRDELWGTAAGRRYLHDPLRTDPWEPTARVASLVSEILAPREPPALRRLHAEARAVEIVAEALAHAISAAAPAPSSPQDRRRRLLDRARGCIESSSEEALSIGGIAREVGMSVSGLQQLFREELGCGVYTFIRLTRLDRAHRALADDLVSVAEASRIAGYASPANFATAFRRRYGTTPRQLRGPASRRAT